MRTKEAAHVVVNYMLARPSRHFVILSLVNVGASTTLCALPEAINCIARPCQCIRHCIAPVIYDLFNRLFQVALSFPSVQSHLVAVQCTYGCKACCLCQQLLGPHRSRLASLLPAAQGLYAAQQHWESNIKSFDN